MCAVAGTQAGKDSGEWPGKIGFIVKDHLVGPLLIDVLIAIAADQNFAGDPGDKGGQPSCYGFTTPWHQAFVTTAKAASLASREQQSTQSEDIYCPHQPPPIAAL
ncbi:hypothetical protein GCM10007418_05320 [Halopseudomonas salina]|uniref:Uncharacterized protein n=1 Tax=Halopseudomonas salina TaxID=1323744 RepID=A0ABQ1P0F2_9GAMM|nr:hypothetical protein GCM10007418_05320 [Halopseudomonas salina]